MVENTIDTANARYENPSGILKLFQYDAVPILIDALLDFPPKREFDATEFADHAGVPHDVAIEHIDLLLEIELLSETPGTSPQEYRIADSATATELYHLNSALNATRPTAGQK